MKRRDKGRIKDGLILRKGYGEFILGVSITKYLQKCFTMKVYKEKVYTNECYIFENDNVEIWCENGIINTIRCDTYCIYNGYNLINMNFNDFLLRFKWEPSDKDMIYLSNNGKGQNQQVYEFEKEGLQIWVWRDKIRTVLIYNPQMYHG